MGDIFDKVNDRGGDDRWRNNPRDDGPMFSKWKDVGEPEMAKGKMTGKDTGKR